MFGKSKFQFSAGLPDIGYFITSLFLATFMLYGSALEACLLRCRWVIHHCRTIPLVDTLPGSIERLRQKTLSPTATGNGKIQLVWPDQPMAEKYSLEPLGSSSMVAEPGVQLAGQTSSGLDWTYWNACRRRRVSSTFLPTGRLLMVA